MPTTEQRKAPLAPGTATPSRRSTGLPLLILAAILVVAGAVAAAVLIIADDGTSPEDAVTQSVEAFNARDLWGLEAVFDPDIVITHDGSAVGIAAIPDEVGRDMVLRNIEMAWLQGDITVAQEILTTEGDTVTTSEIGTFPDGSATKHNVTYRVRDGLIYRIDHVIEE